MTKIEKISLIIWTLSVVAMFVFWFPTTAAVLGVVLAIVAVNYLTGGAAGWLLLFWSL